MSAVSKSFRLERSETIYQGKIVKLVRDRIYLYRARKSMVREMIVHPGAVAIVPMLSPQKMILLRQFRYAAKGDLWEIPAGTLEKGERPIDCAKRELEEETGFCTRSMNKATTFFCAPGVSDEVMTLYVAKGLFPGKMNLDHDEYLTHKVFTVRQAARMIAQGTIRDAKTIVGVSWILNHGFSAT